jgi:hypothetical protein
VGGKLNLRWNSLLFRLTHRKLLSKTLAIENDHRTLRNFGLKVWDRRGGEVRGTNRTCQFGRADFPPSNLPEFVALHESVHVPFLPFAATQRYVWG